MQWLCDLCSYGVAPNDCLHAFCRAHQIKADWIFFVFLLPDAFLAPRCNNIINTICIGNKPDTGQSQRLQAINSKRVKK